VELQIQHISTPTGGRFFIRKGSTDIAEMTWFLNDRRMVIDHTEVSSELKGQGVAKRLVIKGIEYAREHKLKIEALCSYAHHVIHRNKEYQDIL